MKKGKKVIGMMLLIASILILTLIGCKHNNNNNNNNTSGEIETKKENVSKERTSKEKEYIPTKSGIKQEGNDFYEINPQEDKKYKKEFQRIIETGFTDDEDYTVYIIDQISTDDFSLVKCLYKNNEAIDMIQHYFDEKWQENWLYKMAKSTQRKILTKQDINNLMIFKELFYQIEKPSQLIINYIYAFHGYDYKGTKYQAYFEQYLWYKSIKKKKQICDSEFMDSEVRSIDLLQGVECK